MYYLEFDERFGGPLRKFSWEYLWESPGSVEVFSKSAQGRKILLWEVGGQAYFIKKFTTYRHGETYGASNEWERIREVRNRGLNTVCPVAFGYSKNRAFVITLRMPGYSLEDWVLKHECTDFEQVVSSLATYAGRFHLLGYAHQDFYFSHFFWEPSSREIFLIDFQRVRKANNPVQTTYYILKDLAQIMFSASFFLSNSSFSKFKEIFVETYAQHVPLIRRRWFLRALDFKKKKIEKHDLKRKLS